MRTVRGAAARAADGAGGATHAYPRNGPALGHVNINRWKRTSRRMPTGSHARVRRETCTHHVQVLRGAVGGLRLDGLHDFGPHLSSYEIADALVRGGCCIGVSGAG